MPVNTVLHRVFGLQTEKVTEQRNLQIDELCNCQPSPDIIRTIMLRTMRHNGHMARVGNRK